MQVNLCIPPWQRWNIGQAFPRNIHTTVDSSARSQRYINPPASSYIIIVLSLSRMREGKNSQQSRCSLIRWNRWLNIQAGGLE